MAKIYGFKSSDGEPKGVAVNDDGELIVNADSSALPTGAATEQGLDDILAKLSADPATQTTLAAVLAKIIAAPSTEAKQDLIITALGLIGTEATSGDIKTAVEALAVATPDTASGDLASMSADLGTIQADIATVKADIALIKADVAEIPQKVQLPVAIEISSASDQMIIAAPGAGKRIRLTRLSLMSGSNPQINVEIALKSGVTTIETVRGTVMVFDYPEHRNLGTNEAFVVQCTSADRVIGGLDYYVEAV